MTVYSVNSAESLDGLAERKDNTNKKTIQWNGRKVSVPVSAPSIPATILPGHVCKGCKSKDRVLRDSKNVELYLYVSPRPTPSKLEWHKTCAPCAQAKYSNSVKRKRMESISSEEAKPSRNLSRKKRKAQNRVSEEERKPTPPTLLSAPVETCNDIAADIFWENPLLCLGLEKETAVPISELALFRGISWSDIFATADGDDLDNSHLEEDYSRRKMDDLFAQELREGGGFELSPTSVEVKKTDNTSMPFDSSKDNSGLADDPSSSFANEESMTNFVNGFFKTF